MIFISLFFSEEQVLSILQTIFGVKLPKASEEASSDSLALPDTASLLEMKMEDGQTISDHLEYYNELTSDILTEVLMQMAKGKLYLRPFPFFAHFLIIFGAHFDPFGHNLITAFLWV